MKDSSFWNLQAGEPPTEERVKALIQWVVREQNLSPHINYYLAATDVQTGAVMAEAAMKTIPLGQGQGEIGFGITPTNWNKGYTTE